MSVLVLPGWAMSNDLLTWGRDSRLGTSMGPPHYYGAVVPVRLASALPVFYLQAEVAARKHNLKLPRVRPRLLLEITSLYLVLEALLPSEVGFFLQANSSSLQ